MTTLENAQGLSGRIAGRRGITSFRSADVFAAIAGFSALLLIFCLATLVFFWPAMAHLHTAVIGPPEDNFNDFWDTWYAAVAADPHHFFATKLLRFPEGTSLVYQSFAYPQVFAVVALSHVFGRDLPTLIALQNLTSLASFPLAGIGAFYLVRHFAQSTLGALAGAFVFAFNPSHIAQAMHHAGVSSIEFLPFFALFYLFALERRSVAWLVPAAAFYVLSALSCWYYLFYGAYFMGFQLLYARMRDGAWPRGWQVTAPVLCAALAVAVLSPLIVPMMLATGPSVYEPGGDIVVADLLGFFTFPPEHLLSGLSRGLFARFTGNAWEATAYLGLVNLAILGWYWRRGGAARNPLLPYVLSGMLAFSILACGETLHVAGVLTHLPLPDAGLDRLPFFANVRTPSRAIVFVYLFLAIGTGSALAALWQQRTRVKAGAIALAVLLVADFYPANLPATPVACAPELRVLETGRQGGVGVLNLPWGYMEENAYMLEQVCHHLPIVDGMTTRDMGDTLLFRLSLKDLTRQRRQLTGAHVKYILLHRPRLGHYLWNGELAPVAQFLKTYRIVASGPDMVVLRVY
ncbi:MAG TPA: hypothetical protein VHY79_04550 [Rhizomicrobium sp.]|nr:hypothetical protein [Rhizomicrobium sp.]